MVQSEWLALKDIVTVPSSACSSPTAVSMCRHPWLCEVEQSNTTRRNERAKDEWQTEKKPAWPSAS